MAYPCTNMHEHSDFQNKLITVHLDLPAQMDFLISGLLVGENDNSQDNVKLHDIIFIN